MQNVSVNIFGEEYNIKTEEDPAHVEEVARTVDERMREIADSGKIVSTSKIAILASLNIADDLLKCRLGKESGSSAPNRKADKRVEKMILDLRKAIDR